MKFRLYYCHICESRVIELFHNVWKCNKCHLIIEAADIHYNALENSLTIKYIYTKEAENGEDVHKMQETDDYRDSE
jgi:ribosomal protein L37AE/L43A